MVMIRDINICIYICMYICCRVKNWSKILALETGPSLVLKTGPFFLLFSPFFIVFLGIFENTNSVTLCQNSVLQNFGDVKNEVFEKKMAFFVFVFLCWRNRNRKKKKMEKAKKPYKNRFF